MYHIQNNKGFDYSLTFFSNKRPSVVKNSQLSVILICHQAIAIELNFPLEDCSVFGDFVITLNWYRSLEKQNTDTTICSLMCASFFNFRPHKNNNVILCVQVALILGHIKTTMHVILCVQVSIILDHTNFLNILGYTKTTM